MDRVDSNKKFREMPEVTYADEKKCAAELIKSISLSPVQNERIQKNALNYIEYIRAQKTSGMEGILQEYSLSNDEGVALMCLAEALLRIPDNVTATQLVEDKLGGKSWKSHIGKSNSTFVNAATLGLLVTGAVVDMGESGFAISRLINRLGEPVILKAVRKAIKIISNEFIIGEDLPKALKTAKNYAKEGYRFSFDILGESSRTAGQAEYYYNAYIKAIEDLAKAKAKSIDIHERHNLSVKLTALHPKVMLRKEERVFEELMPRLEEIVRLCIKTDVTLSFDAEESYRQDIYLKLLTALHDKFPDFEGIGFVIQGYQKRTFHIIDYIIDLAKRLGKRIPVRLVKGAYWDTEIKHAQENGLPGYPVFTRKEFTDVSYLACAQKIIAAGAYIYPQFATHNAYTAAAIIEMAKHKNFEFQKLQGMGNVLHKRLLAEGYSSRIYAPVGKYEDLLAYLMRRLLENGANTSFVNLIANNNILDEQIAANPVESAKLLLDVPLKVCLPKDIYSPARRNSTGYEPGILRHFEELNDNCSKYNSKEYEAVSIINGKQHKATKEYKEVLKPANNKETVGKVFRADNEQLLEALGSAYSYFPVWSSKTAQERADVITKVGDIFHENRYELYSLLMREGGKNIEDCISEVREAIDFARYYATEAVRLAGRPVKLPGYTGESNELSLHGRGVFVCISPWNFPLAIFATLVHKC